MRSFCHDRFTSFTKSDTASSADLFERPPNCLKERAFEFSRIVTRRLQKTFSHTFDRNVRRLIGRVVQTGTGPCLGALFLMRAVRTHSFQQLGHSPVDRTKEQTSCCKVQDLRSSNPVSILFRCTFGNVLWSVEVTAGRTS